MILGLAIGFGIEPCPLSKWKRNWSRQGVGFDDAPLLASRLPTRVLFTNTHLNRFPSLNLVEPPPEAEGQFGFLLCSDVLEHVPPPVQPAFDGMAAILKPGGFAVVSVPMAGGTTTEHYPGLTDFEVLDGPVVRWRDATGEWRLDENPEMHGGTGLVLAFRLFGEKDFQEGLRKAGFDEVSTLPSHPELGIFELSGAGVYLARRTA